MGGRHTRMGPERARKVIFVWANLRLQNEDFKKRKFTGWGPESVESDFASGDDCCGDDFDNKDSSGDESGRRHPSLDLNYCLFAFFVERSKG